MYIIYQENNLVKIRIMLENKQDNINIQTDNPEEIADATDINFLDTYALLFSAWSEWKMWPLQAIEQINSWDILSVLTKLDEYEDLDSEVATLLVNYW